MRIIDQYILRKYLTTFIFTLLILVPIAIAIDVSEKIDKFLRNSDLTFFQILTEYYVNFTIYYANTFMPLALFIAVIFFTSKLANNTEVIAITSAQISFIRFLKPYFWGALIVSSTALVMNHLVVPKSNATLSKFENYHLNKNRSTHKLVKNFSLQLNDTAYVYIKSFNINSNSGYYFSYETYNNNKLTYKLTGDRVSWNPNQKTYTLTNYRERKIYNSKDLIASGTTLDTTFSFTPKDMVYNIHKAREMTSGVLYRYIKKSQARGVKNLNVYLVEIYKRTSLPISTFILTLIAVSLSNKKKRGGMGVNLAIGIVLMFIYVFFMRISEVLGAVSGNNPLVLVWLPNVIFGILSIFLFIKAYKK